MTTQRRRFVVTVEAVEDQGRAPAISRFRQWLKKGWREFGLRCVTGHEVGLEPKEKEPEPPEEKT